MITEDLLKNEEELSKKRNEEVTAAEELREKKKKIVSCLGEVNGKIKELLRADYKWRHVYGQNINFLKLFIPLLVIIDLPCVTWWYFGGLPVYITAILAVFASAAVVFSAVINTVTVFEKNKGKVLPIIAYILLFALIVAGGVAVLKFRTHLSSAPKWLVISMNAAFAVVTPLLAAFILRVPMTWLRNRVFAKRYSECRSAYEGKAVLEQEKSKLKQQEKELEKSIKEHRKLIDGLEKNLEHITAARRRQNEISKLEADLEQLPEDADVQLTRLLQLKNKNVKGVAGVLKAYWKKLGTFPTKELFSYTEMLLSNAPNEYCRVLQQRANDGDEDAEQKIDEILEGIINNGRTGRLSKESITLTRALAACGNERAMNAIPLLNMYEAAVEGEAKPMTAGALYRKALEEKDAAASYELLKKAAELGSVEAKSYIDGLRRRMVCKYFAHGICGRRSSEFVVAHCSHDDGTWRICTDYRSSDTN